MSRKHEILVRETFVPARILDVQRRKCVKSAASRQHHARIMPKLGGHMWHIAIEEICHMQSLWELLPHPTLLLAHRMILIRVTQ